MIDKTITPPSDDDTATIESLVSQLSQGDIPKLVAVNRAARLGWVLIPDYPIIAQHVSSRQCASCEQWEYSGYHMGMCDGYCTFHDDDRQDIDSCSEWEICPRIVYALVAQ